MQNNRNLNFELKSSITFQAFFIKYLTECFPLTAKSGLSVMEITAAAYIRAT